MENRTAETLLQTQPKQLFACFIPLLWKDEGSAGDILTRSFWSPCKIIIPGILCLYLRTLLYKLSSRPCHPLTAWPRADPALRPPLARSDVTHLHQVDEVLLVLGHAVAPCRVFPVQVQPVKPVCAAGDRRGRVSETGASLVTFSQCQPALLPWL